MTIKLLAAALLAAPAALVAVPAAAQVQGIATASPTIAVANSKAWTAANQQINAANKPALDQLAARQTALEKEVAPFELQMDANKDKQVSQDEFEAAQKARTPAYVSWEASQRKAQEDMVRLGMPVLRARLFALEKILENYNTAQTNMINAKKISIMLVPSAIMYAPNAVDVTAAITAEIDKLVPSVPSQPPANWNPQQQTVSFYEQVAEYDQRRAAAAQQQRPAPAAGQPARPANQPQTPPPGR